MSNPYSNRANLSKAQRKARQYDPNLVLKPSTRKYKKLDAFLRQDGGLKKVASFGDRRYTDFILSGDTAKKKAYRQRHAKDLNKPGRYTAGKLAWYILW